MLKGRTNSPPADFEPAVFVCRKCSQPLHRFTCSDGDMLFAVPRVALFCNFAGCEMEGVLVVKSPTLDGGPQPGNDPATKPTL